MAQAFIDLIGILYKVEVENQVLGRTEKEIVKHRGEESLPVLHDLYQQATALLKLFEKNEIKLSAKLQQALKALGRADSIYEDRQRLDRQQLL